MQKRPGWTAKFQRFANAWMLRWEFTSEGLDREVRALSESKKPNESYSVYWAKIRRARTLARDTGVRQTKFPDVCDACQLYVIVIDMRAREKHTLPAFSNLISC